MGLLRIALSALLLAAAGTVTSGETLTSVVETRFYYEDLDRAARFYREHLGLVPVEVSDESVVLEIAPGARLTLATLASGGFTPDTPRTAAIALVTDQLDEWWGALSIRDLDMRSRDFDSVPGRPHDGFVLEDPEGWYLEFERFNAHPENERLMPQLDALDTRVVDVGGADLPAGLGFKATITWFYYEDLDAAEAFVAKGLGLPLVTDQGWAKIHPVSSTAYLGLVDGARGMHGFTPEKAVVLEIHDPAARMRSRELEAGGIPVKRLADGVIEVRDPGGYPLRWR